MFDLAAAQHSFLHQVDKLARMGRGGSTDIVAFEDGRLTLLHQTSERVLHGPTGKRTLASHVMDKVRSAGHFLPEVSSVQIHYSIQGEPLGYALASDEVLARTSKAGANNMGNRFASLKAAYGLAPEARFTPKVVGVVNAKVCRDATGDYHTELQGIDDRLAMRAWVNNELASSSTGLT